MKLPELKMEAINYGTADWQTQTSGARSLAQAYGAEAQRKGNELTILDYLNAGTKVVAQGLDIANDINKSILDKKTADFQNSAMNFQELSSGKINSHTNADAMRLAKSAYKNFGLSGNDLDEALKQPRTMDAIVQYSIQKGIENGTLKPESVTSILDKTFNEFMYLDEKEEPINRDLAPAYAAKFNLLKTQTMNNSIHNIKAWQIQRGIEDTISQLQVTDSSETKILKTQLEDIKKSIESERNNIDFATKNIADLKKKIAPMSSQNSAGEIIKKGIKARFDVMEISNSIFFDKFKKNIDNLEGIADQERGREIQDSLYRELTIAKQKDFISSKLSLGEEGKNKLNNSTVDEFIGSLDKDTAMSVRQSLAESGFNISIQEDNIKLSSYLDVAKEAIDAEKSINGFENDLIGRKSNYEKLNKEFIEKNNKLGQSKNNDKKPFVDYLEKVASDLYKTSGSINSVDANGKMITGSQVIHGALTKTIGSAVKDFATILDKNGVPLKIEEVLMQSGIDQEKHKNIYLAAESAVGLMRQNYKINELANAPYIWNSISKNGDKYSLFGFTKGETKLFYDWDGNPIQSAFKEEIPQEVLKELYEKGVGGTEVGKKRGEYLVSRIDKMLGETFAYGKENLRRINFINSLKERDIFIYDSVNGFALDADGNFIINEQTFKDAKITDKNLMNEIAAVVQGGIRESSPEMVAAYKELTLVTGNPFHNGDKKQAPQEPFYADDLSSYIGALYYNQIEGRDVKVGKNSTLDALFETFKKDISDPKDMSTLDEYLKGLDSTHAKVEAIQKLGGQLKDPNDPKKGFEFSTKKAIDSLKGIASDSGKEAGQKILERVNDNTVKNNINGINSNPKEFKVYISEAQGGVQYQSFEDGYTYKLNKNGVLEVQIDIADGVLTKYTDRDYSKAALTANQAKKTIMYKTINDKSIPKGVLYGIMATIGTGTASWGYDSFFGNKTNSPYKNVLPKAMQNGNDWDNSTGDKISEDINLRKGKK